MARDWIMNKVWDIVVQYWPKLLDGLGITMELTVISIILGTILGIVLALGRVYGNKFVYAVATSIIEAIRGTPLLVQLFILYFGLPPMGISLSPTVAALIGFTINSGAYQAEYIRGSIQSIGTNQMKAARSIGMTRNQAVRCVILPQAFRRVVPAWTNEFIYLLKYTSLAFIVQAPELMAQAKFIASRNYQFFEVYTIVAIIKIGIVLLFTWLFSAIERHFKIPGLETVR